MKDICKYVIKDEKYFDLHFGINPIKITRYKPKSIEEGLLAMACDNNIYNIQDIKDCAVFPREFGKFLADETCEIYKEFLIRTLIKEMDFESSLLKIKFEIDKRLKLFENKGMVTDSVEIGTGKRILDNDKVK